MTNRRPYLLSVAGFDPSGGAGVMADIKTMEAHAVYGLGVSSALTWQNGVEFKRVEWLDNRDIIGQIQVLARRFNFRVVKIGLIEDIDTLVVLVDFLHTLNPEIRIIWDPVLAASTGFRFHRDIKVAAVHDLINRLALITPNRQEAQSIFDLDEDPIPSLENRVANGAVHCPILVTGNRTAPDEMSDILITRTGTEIIRGQWLEDAEKHGSGCVLSSAIAAGLAQGHDLQQACRNAKHYLQRFLAGGQDQLGFHYPNQCG
jgi:hydroxymethylpyrimidine/phosphomethylpyrimidine kinase